MTLVFTFLFVTLLQFSLLFTSVDSATKDDWRRRSVYQLMTDRFARDNDTDNSACDPLRFCGGTYKGLINHLDWIQDMGFSAVSHLST
jgi:alpha-amylase